MTNPPPPHPCSQPWSRRHFLLSATALAALPAASRLAAAAPHSTPASFAFVGTYNDAPGAGGNGEGIYLFRVNPITGQLTQRTLVAATPNPSWIVLHPSRRFLYAVNEVANFQGGKGSVSAFALDPTSDPATARLTPLNTVSSQGAGPAFLSLDAAGRFAFVANYGGGSIAVLPILPDGRLVPAVDVHRDLGSIGSTRATSAPPGSFAISGHDAPHAHMIAPDPQGHFVLATDLGQDRIYTYRFDDATGRLTPPAAAPFVSLPTGDGPRHFAFHPNGRWLYSIQEEASTVVFFLYDSATGALAEQQTVSALPAGFAGTSFASEILISPDGRFLYAANRLHNSIAVFAIAATGRLTHLQQVPTLGDYPSQCRIAPDGRFLYACNRRSDSITTFRIHRTTGRLSFTGQYTAVGSPGSITFL